MDSGGRKGWGYYLVYASLAVMVLGLVLVKCGTPPREPARRVPRDANHADLRDFQRCPTCHGPGSGKAMPVKGDRTHVTPDGALRRDFQKCHLCHERDGGDGT